MYRWKRSSLSLFGVVFAGLSVIIGSMGIATAVSAQPVTGIRSVQGVPCIQPPQNEDLTKLSDADLRLYGLPIHPQSARDLARWTFELQHVKHRTCALIPTNKMHVPHLVQAGYLNEEESTNWAGAVALNNGYQQVSAQWILPCATSTATTYQNASVWVGLGGDNNDGGGNLVQAGTQSRWDYGGQRQYTYTAWIEDYPFNSEQDLPWTPNCGDQMQVTVDNNDYYPGQVYYFVADVAPGQGQYFGQAYPWPLSNGSTADWIVERDAQLVKFTTSGCPSGTYCVTFNPCNVVQNGTSYSIGELPTHSVVMVNYLGSSHELAFPGPVHNNVLFNVYWLAST